MSDYNIRPKPKVWAGSPNEQAPQTSAERSAELRPNVVCLDETTFFTGELIERPGNVVVSKHVSTHASSEMADSEEKLQNIIYEQNNQQVGVILQTYRWTTSLETYFEICRVLGF